jgi:hypothetical protein
MSVLLLAREWDQAARVFDHSKLERLVRDKPSSLLDPFVGVSYEQITSVNTHPGTVFTTLHFFA